MQNRLGSNAAGQCRWASRWRGVTGIRQVQNYRRKQTGLKVRLRLGQQKRDGYRLGSAEMKRANGAIVWVVSLVVQVGTGAGMVGVTSRLGTMIMVQQQVVAALEHQRCQKDEAQQSGLDMNLRVLHAAIWKQNVQM